MPNTILPLESEEVLERIKMIQAMENITVPGPISRRVAGRRLFDSPPLSIPHIHAIDLPCLEA
jgi:hypothetical protein